MSIHRYDLTASIVEYKKTYGVTPTVEDRLSLAGIIFRRRAHNVLV
jgi:hypothetical protein